MNEKIPAGMVFSNEALAAYQKSYTAIVLCVTRRHPNISEYVRDIVSDAFIETVRKYPDKTTAHLVNIWRLVSVNRSVDFIRKRKHLVRLGGLERAPIELINHN